MKNRLTVRHGMLSDLRAYLKQSGWKIEEPVGEYEVLRARNPNYPRPLLVHNGIEGSMLVKCSVCGFDCGANSFSYCPNCGARMRQAKRGKVRRKYGEILKLYRYCVEVRMDARLERLHDGWAIRFPNGGDFAQHAGTYGTNDGFVEPAIGCEADYSPVSLREAEKLICENRKRLMTPSC